MSQRRSDFSASSDPLRVASPKLQVAELAIFTDEEVFNEDGVSFLTFFIVVIALGCCALAGFGLYLRTQQKKDAAVALLTDIGFEMDAPPSKEEVLAMQKLRSSDIERAFDAHDTDHSGGVDKTELLTLLGSYGFQLEPQYVEQLWATFDTDSSGTLDKQEFTALMHQCASKPRPMPIPSDF